MLVFAVLMLFIEPAHAYLDPGTGSILLQGLIAAIAGTMVTARLYWGKIKSMFSRNSENDSQQTEEKDSDD